MQGRWVLWLVLWTLSFPGSSQAAAQCNVSFIVAQHTRGLDFEQETVSPIVGSALRKIAGLQWHVTSPAQIEWWKKEGIWKNTSLCPTDSVEDADWVVLWSARIGSWPLPPLPAPKPRTPPPGSFSNKQARDGAVIGMAIQSLAEYLKWLKLNRLRENVRDNALWAYVSAHRVVRADEELRLGDTVFGTFHSEYLGSERGADVGALEEVLSLVNQNPNAVRFGITVLPRQLKVFRVQPGSIAERMGILKGDKLRKINGKKVKRDSPRNNIERFLNLLKPGTTVKIQVERLLEDRKRTVELSGVI